MDELYFADYPHSEVKGEGWMKDNPGHVIGIAFGIAVVLFALYAILVSLEVIPGRSGNKRKPMAGPKSGSGGKKAPGKSGKKGVKSRKSGPSEPNIYDKYGTPMMGPDEDYDPTHVYGLPGPYSGCHF